MKSLMDREVRQSLGRAAMRRAKESFDVSTMVRAYEELYEDLVGRPRPGIATTTFQRTTVPVKQAGPTR